MNDKETETDACCNGGPTVLSYNAAMLGVRETCLTDLFAAMACATKALQASVGTDGKVNLELLEEQIAVVGGISDAIDILASIEFEPVATSRDE